MRVVAIIQARMGAERLPGKVLLDIGGRPMLEHVVARVGRSSLIDEVVVATTLSSHDDVVAAAAKALGASVARGSEDDVLARFAGAAAQFDAQVIVRVCADSPFIDPEICDLVIERFLDASPPVDYASNKLQPTFPLGLDVEAFSRDALERADAEANTAWERSHVTVHMYRNPDRFSLLPVTDEVDRHTWRWTVDTPEDLAFARHVFGKLYRGNAFSWREVVQLMEAEPAIASINSAVPSRPLEAG